MLYEWTTSKDDALVLSSDEQGRFEIDGLSAGKYYLEEKKAPKGFAKLTTPVEFTVGAGTYASATATDGHINYNSENANNGKGLQIKNNDITIPQTGGIGTIIFTVAGLVIMATAILSLRRKKADNN